MGLVGLGDIGKAVVPLAIGLGMEIIAHDPAADRRFAEEKGVRLCSLGELLAEADVDYEKLREMDDVNPEMEQIDVAIVLGANDVVNPVARTDPDSPIAGMPIIDVDKARTVIVIKRSLSPGFAGIPNPLFAMDNTLMFFNDGKKAIQDILNAVKEG